MHKTVVSDRDTENRSTAGVEPSHTPIYFWSFMFNSGTLHGDCLIDTLKTVNEFKFDPGRLNDGSHKKVWFRCLSCNTSFTKEYRKRDTKHSCPRIVNIDSVRHKWCPKCKSYRNVNLFSMNQARHDKLSSVCKLCNVDKPSPYKTECKNKASIKRISTLHNWIKWYASCKKSRCKRHNVLYNLDSDFLLEMWNSQFGKCYYSGISMIYGKDTLFSASLDRLDPDLGYVRGNVVWCTKAMNGAKNKYNTNDFMEFISMLKRNKVRVEYKKLHQDAQLPKRANPDDAASDVYSIEDVVISPGETASVNTGLVFVVPSGFYVTINGRSSMNKRGLIPFRGIIDAGYNGPLIVNLTNSGVSPYLIKKGDRIAQITLHHVIDYEAFEVEEFSDKYSMRGTKGFGSSGA